MEVVMPKMGESVNEGTILKWHKKAGDFVKRDEIIFEISTDKVDTEIPSPAEGILSDIKVQEGETVEVGTVVAYIKENGDASNKQEQTKNPEKTEEKSVSAPVKDEKFKAPVVESKVESPVGGKDQTTSSKSGESLIEIAMPKMGESVMEGTIIKWHKKVGDVVKKDETIFEISTDKVDTEVPSPVEGTLAEILIGEQETVDVGTVVAKISTSEPMPRTSAEKGVEEPIAAVQDDSSDAKRSGAKEAAPGIAQDSMHSSITGYQKPEEQEYIREETGFLSPLVLNIARQEKISFDELKRIKGTGLNERITKKDILGYIEKKKSQPAPSEKVTKAAPAEPARTTQESEAKSWTPSPQQVSSNDVEIIPMDNIRQKIMNHMVNSRDTSVHVTAMLEVDMSKIYNFIKNNKDEFLTKEGIKLTYMPFIATAVVKALKEYPLVNSAIDGNNIVQKKYVNLGIAVAMEPNGLIVPNIKGAEGRNLIGIAKSIVDLATRARTKKLTPDDISQGTFTITNYGVFGTIFGTPIINQPEVAILGVGAVIKKPVVVEVDDSDTIAIRHIMALTLAHDHRLVDGMLGGKFLKFIKDTLESFTPGNL